MAATPIVAISICPWTRVSIPGGPSAKRSDDIRRRGTPGQIPSLLVLHGWICHVTPGQANLLFERHLLQQMVDSRFVCVFGRPGLSNGVIEEGVSTNKTAI